MTLSLRSRFDAFPRRAILLGTDKLAVYHWQKGQLGESFIFDTNEEGKILFERYLRETPKDTVYILADFPEEEFRQETVPHVFGSDRQAVIARKQARLFRDTTYCYASIQGRETGGRRDDRVLLTSVTKPSLLKPWLEILERNKIPLAAVSSVALFTEKILDLIPDSSDQMLVVSMQSVSGLRQSFFSGKELKISRVIKMPRYGVEPYSPIINDEVEKIRRYLSSLRLISGQDPLNIYFLTHGNLKNELMNELVNSDMHKYHILDLADLARDSGLNVEIKSPFSDVFYVYHALKKKLTNSYSKKRDMRYFTMRKLRFGLFAASTLLLLAGSIYSGLNFMSALNYKQESILAAKKTNFYNERYQMAREGLPETPVEPRELKAIFNIAEDLKKYKATPVPMLKLISSCLDQYPSIVLDELQWAKSTDPNYKIGDTQIKTPNPAIPVIATGDKQAEGELYYQIAIIDAHLDEFDGNYRTAITMINDFAEDIRSKMNVHDVTVVSLPLDISSESSLRGNVHSQNKDAPFSLKIALGIKDETG